MKVKLTKRSKTDKTLVTIPLAQFNGSGLHFRPSARSGEEVTVVIEGIPTICIFARRNCYGDPTAMTTHGLPRFIRLPQVGRPVYVEVSDIR